MAARKNPGGGKGQDKLWADALRIAIKEQDKTGKPKIRALAEKCVQKALEGDMVAMKEIGDRLDGKPTQALVGGGEDDQPLVVKIVKYAGNQSSE